MKCHTRKSVGGKREQMKIVVLRDAARRNVTKILPTNVGRIALKRPVGFVKS